MTLPIVSVVIPARNEFPNIVHTIYSIWHCWESGGGDPKEIEIIIVDNCSNDSDVEKPAVKGTTTYLEGRGAYYGRAVRVVKDPLCGNHTARNTGAELALGKYLFFSDAHMAYAPGAIHLLMKTVDESGGIVHCPIAWMGAYPSHAVNGKPHGLGMGYTIKLGEEWKGTWAPHVVDKDKWFYIPSLGHCSLMMDRLQFKAFGGYQKVHRTIGGGEIYLDLKWWMMGSSVAIHPRAVGYHLASSRGYTYIHNDYKENVLGCAYALGCDDWRERAYINWMRETPRAEIDTIYKRSSIDHERDRKFIMKKKKKSFNQVIVEQPWNVLNQERLGKTDKFLSIFHDTWLELLYKGIPKAGIKPAPGYVIDYYESSPIQKELEKFINANLDEYVYKRKR